MGTFFKALWLPFYLNNGCTQVYKQPLNMNMSTYCDTCTEK
jgi:hypothetical protein